ncbi:SDR family oxidoreductase [Actinoplanes bogorensis]|uniref:SDR family oxidoreductase n=1 Tax=Paractinoplanes bogorensis TaxID=1610840 RepID=A0ABS5YTV7_9ACTN|nr:SDR family oxidoreductase [Actinoplanes bogorensis]MBU2666501.1 SDR family oxidoreductase [Actinoplanes bogorensis]
MPESLTGQVVIVTGASSGIGAATVRLLHAAGAHPVLAARRADRLDALSEELGGALAVPTDVTVPAQVRALAEATMERHGRIDGLVNNAGAGSTFRIEDLDPDDYLDLYRLNVISVVNGVQAVLPHMRKAGHGRIVNVSSGSVQTAETNGLVGPYAATKAALNLLTHSIGLQLAADGIEVSLVSPRITATEFNDGAYDRPSIEMGAVTVVPHSPAYVGRVILRALRTGEARIDIPAGPEQPDFPDAG